MTTTTDLVAAALAAADLFRDGDTPDQPDIRNLVRAADSYKSKPHEDSDGCVACLVRAMTEGEPTNWWPGEPGAAIQGIVLKIGTQPSRFPWAPDNTTDTYVDLWLGGLDRVRVVMIGAHLVRQFEMAAPVPGDAITVEFESWGEIQGGKNAGRKFKKFRLDVKRGHH